MFGELAFEAVSAAMSRALAKFRGQKLLRVSGKSIVITQPRKLNALLRKHSGEI
jgi:CRP-like cAMP-binding protein